MIIIRELGELGSQYFKKSLLKKEKRKPVATYSSNHIQIGRNIKNGKVFSIDVSEACRICVIGSTRSGKTWLFRVLADRLKKTDYDVIHLSDIKNEMFSSNWPLQEKFREFLLKGEEPISYNVVSLRPTFFRTFNKNLKKFNYWYSIDMKEMSKGDFFTLVGAPKWKNANQLIALEMIYPELNKRLKNGEKFSVELLTDIAQNIEEIDGRSFNALKMKFMPLKYYDFYDENYERSVTELLRNGYVVTINLEDYDRFEKGAFMFTETTLSMVMRELIEARKNRKLRQLWFLIDESSRFLANDKNNAFKDDVLEAVDVTARYGVNFVFAWQHGGDVPDKILNQSRYIFIPAESDTKTIQNIVSNAGTTKYIQHIPNEARRLKQAAKRVKHAWFIFDRRTNSIHLVKPIAPLTWHLETSH